MIRLLSLGDHGELRLDSFDDEPTAPCYAILSHTWSTNTKDELSFEDVLEGARPGKPGYDKVMFCLRQAAKDGLQYCWVDTCCIDKTNSVELSTAIISMFRWYQKSTRCYVYLTDVSYNGPAQEAHCFKADWERSLEQSRWFTRCWTLQELLAPSRVDFFSKEHVCIGDKLILQSSIHAATGIPVDALQGRPVNSYSVDDRIEWASGRYCRIPEDKALCLCGIFDVTVIPAYGEGEERAFRRLMDEVQRSQRRDEEEQTASRHNDHREQPSAKRPRLEASTTPNVEQTTRLMGSLSFDQLEERQMTIKIAHARTCKWILQLPKYLDWLDTSKFQEHQGFFWIKGKPGSGKSTMMKFIFENIRKKMKQTLLLSFFFNARGAGLEKSTNGTYRTLLFQLLQRVPSLQTVFDILGSLASRIGQDYQWSTETLEELLREAFRNLGSRSVICIIDALDECAEEEVREMISFLTSLCELSELKPGQVRICLASRHYPHITIRMGLSITLEDESDHQKDIINYLESELRIGRSKLADEIRSDLVRKASGVFIWIYFVVGLLNKEYDHGNLHRLRQKLLEIPDDIHDLFYNILTRDNRNKDAMVLCLQFVLFCRSPLTVQELFSAIHSTESNSVSASLDDLVPTFEHARMYILDVSKGLTELTRSKKRPTVQFIHESVRDFLLKSNGLSAPSCGSNNLDGVSHERLKQCCLAYIGPEVFDKSILADPAETSEEQGSRVEKMYPFLRYAVQNVLYHADRAAEKGICQSDFITDFNTSRWVAISNWFERYKIRKYKTDNNLLYILATVNAPNLVKVHPHVLSYLEPCGERYRNPLFAALAVGEAETVCAFLEEHAKKAPIKCQNALELFKTSVCDGHWRGDFGRESNFLSYEVWCTVLFRNAHCSLIAFIIETGDYDTELRSCGIERTLRTVLDNTRRILRFEPLAAIRAGGEPCDRESLRDDQNPTTSAIRCAECAFGAIVRLAARVGERIKFGDAFNVALQCNNIEFVKCLLDRTAEARATIDFRAAVDTAARHGNIEVLELILEKPAVDFSNTSDAVFDVVAAMARDAPRCYPYKFFQLFQRSQIVGVPIDFNLAVLAASKHLCVIVSYPHNGSPVASNAETPIIISQTVTKSSAMQIITFLIRRASEVGDTIDYTTAVLGTLEAALSVGYKTLTSHEYWSATRKRLDTNLVIPFCRTDVIEFLIDEAISAGLTIDFHNARQIAFMHYCQNSKAMKDKAFKDPLDETGLNALLRLYERMFNDIIEFLDEKEAKI